MSRVQVQSGRIKSLTLYSIERSWLPVLKLTSVSDSQSWKAKSPMVMTESGIAIVMSDLQELNAYAPMVTTESGIVIVTSDVQP